MTWSWETTGRRDIPAAQTVSFSFTAYQANFKLTAVRNCEETTECIRMKKYCTGLAKMQKWQKDKAQLLAFPAKYYVNLNVQLYREVCSKDLIWIITTVTFPLSFQSLKGSCFISGVILYIWITWMNEIKEMCGSASPSRYTWANIHEVFFAIWQRTSW